MSRSSETFGIKNSSIAIGAAAIISIATGIGMYLKRDQIKRYFSGESETVVNDVNTEIENGSENNLNSIPERETKQEQIESTPVPIQKKPNTILHTLVQENEKIRKSKSGSDEE